MVKCGTFLKKVLMKKIIFPCIVVFVVIFYFSPKDPPKEKKYFTASELYVHRYLASDLQIQTNQQSASQFFISTRVFGYCIKRDTVRIMLSKYPLAFIEKNGLSGVCFFGTKIGDRVYTRASFAPGEVYFDSSELYKQDPITTRFN